MTFTEWRAFWKGAVLVAVLWGCWGCDGSSNHSNRQGGIPPCGHEQAVDVWIEHATDCAALSGEVLFDPATVRVEGTAEHCAVWTNVIPAAGARDASVRWAAQCPLQPLSRLRLLTLAVTPMEPTTLWPHVQLAVDSARASCGAWAWPVTIECQ